MREPGGLAPEPEREPQSERELVREQLVECIG